ncbi:MAG: hypothetical protein GX610_05355 [Rhodococcus sp.]|nr:hypothetical protein [Rhodococcus sp. (in: high G+C Gram-positive bacteria)]
MKSSNVTRVAAAAAAAGLLLTGCGSSDDEATTGAAASSTQASNLDTGTFPTTPQPEFGTPPAEAATLVEGQRMGEFVVLPEEIDPILIDVTRNAARPLKDFEAAGLGPEAVAPTLEDSFVAGFTTSAGSAKENYARVLGTTVVRFEDADAADAARETVTAAMLEFDYQVEYEYDVPVPVFLDPIEGLPNTTVITEEFPPYGDETENGLTVTAITPHNDYLLVTQMAVPASSKQWADQSITTFVEQQVPLIDQFPATPVEEIPDTTMDQDKVLIYTIPNQDGESSVTFSDMAVYGPRGAGAVDPHFRRTYQRMVESNVKHVGIGRTTVYETASEEDAKNLVDGLVEDNLDVEGTIVVDPPVGLEEAQCVDVAENIDGKTCWVANGRFVGQAASDLSDTDPTEVNQLIAAQYLILDHAK